MDDIISHATDLINQILNSCSTLKESPLINTRHDLNRLLELDPLKNDWIRLFCRQLKRLMTHDVLIKNDQFWIDLHNDILCMLNQSNNQHNIAANWESFIERMKFEAKLEQRQIMFEQKYGKRKGLSDLLSKNPMFIFNYISECICFHSKVQMQDLVENIDDLLRDIDGLPEINLNSDHRKYLEEKLKSIEISLIHRTISVEGLYPTSMMYDDSHKVLNSTPATFLPSTNQLQYSGLDDTVSIERLLRLERWFVIIGEPGSAKTSLLRWLVLNYANQVLDHIRGLNWERNPSTISRIPIFIRLVEFALWLDEHPRQTLIDYIGEHTWFSARYCLDDTENVLRELIFHGYALILFDGLDEICEVERRGKIAFLLRNFIDQYAQSSEFFSAYDDDDIRIKRRYEWTTYIFHQKSPSVSVGNQILVTSRILGYQMYPLHNHSIYLYSIVSMKNEEAKVFARELLSNIERQVTEILQYELVRLWKKPIRILATNRDKTIESIFENYPKSLLFNPSLIVSICISLFRSSKEFSRKSRIEVYENTVQSIFVSWKNHHTNLSEKLLFNFLIELAVYLHCNSSSGLIDAFDMENLCFAVLKQYYQSNDWRKLRHNAKELISSLDSNLAILTAQGLQVFGFLHRTYQEYFVAQSLIRESSMENILERILSNALDSRFREPLLLALGWISWKWSSDDYEQFCHLLVKPRRDFAIPLGSLLLFDALDDLQKLPSNSIISIALNNLFQHSSNFIPRKYFLLNLLKLPQEILIEWMKVYLNDEKLISKFCQYLLEIISESKSSYPRASIIYQQLNFLYDRNPAIQFIIDQTMRKLVSLEKFSINQLHGNIFSEDIFISDVHPLILSIIIAVCGGIDFQSVKEIHSLRFSSKKMHRQSSILVPIVDYLKDKDEIHSIKLQRLIEYFQRILENTSLADVSIDTIDTFVALICLQGVVNQVMIYDEYQAFPIATERFKQICFYLNRTFENLIPSHDQTRKSFIESELKIIFNDFFSQTNEDCLIFSFVCAAAWRKLNPACTLDWFNLDIFHSKNIDQYFECQAEFKHYIINRKIEQMMENRHALQIFKHQPFFLLTFLPQSLQPLYSHLFRISNDNSICLPIIILLSHCLIFLDESSPWNVDFYLSILMLLPWFEEHHLQSYASILFQQGNFTKLRSRNEDRDAFFKAISEQIFIDQTKNWEKLIDIERQRIIEIKNQSENSEKDLRYFAASICLARLYQERYGSAENSTKTPIDLSRSESEEIYFACMNILDPILRIVALSMILNVKYISIFDQEQRNQFNLEVINQFKVIVSNKILAISTLLFLRCYTICQTFSVVFQYAIDMIGKQLNETLSNNKTEEQKAVFIALQHLDHPDLSYHLAKFVQQTDNLSDLLLFNSPIFYRYFNSTTSWKSSNPILLSSMYLTELAFDVQILIQYKNSVQKTNRFSPKEKLEILWKEFSQRILTLKIARWITNYLQISDREDFDLITRKVCNCLRVEKPALIILEKWLEYRMDKNLRIFTYYATLILTREGFTIPHMIEIINELFSFDTKFYFKYLIENIFRISSINPVFIRQILINLHGNRRYFTQISIIEIDCQEILQLILTLELERITTNEKITQSYLSMIHSCSKKLENFLQEYISQSINEEYIAVMIRWTIEMSIHLYYLTKFSKEFYQWIFQFLDNDRYPQCQKAILNALNSLFNSTQLKRDNFFLHYDLVHHMEKIFSSWKTCTEDILGACLLTYGSYILKLKTLRQNPNISDEIRTTLLILYQNLSSEVLSIRAGFCLIFIDYSDIKFKTISTWFENKQTVTLKQRYLICLQMNLYKTLNSIYTWDTEIIKEFIDVFIIDLYHYLYNRENLDYLADPQPNYIEIALDFCKKHLVIFRHALLNSSFDENDFRKELCLYFYQTNQTKDREILIQFYVVLYMITVELIQMLKWFDFIEDMTNGWRHIQDIKMISDRDSIESIFQCLDSTACNRKSRSFVGILKILGRFTQDQLVSLVEVHQNVARAIENWSYDDDDQRRDEEDIFKFLLEITCIKEIPSTYHKEELFTEKRIEKYFQEQIRGLKTQSALFLRRNYFLMNYRSISSNTIPLSNSRTA